MPKKPLQEIIQGQANQAFANHRIYCQLYAGNRAKLSDWLPGEHWYSHYRCGEFSDGSGDNPIRCVSDNSFSIFAAPGLLVLRAQFGVPTQVDFAYSENPLATLQSACDFGGLEGIHNYALSYVADGKPFNPFPTKQKKPAKRTLWMYEALRWFFRHWEQRAMYYVPAGTDHDQMLGVPQLQTERRI